ncbi:MAG: hypothetical protein IJC26_03960, partial [Clostridia bacterium]|nr:hypothetical protein [Clostridia bacterium]
KYGKTATLMPKPVYGEAGNGMHVHILLMKDGQPVFSDDNGYSNLSREAHYFMGGLLKHIASLCAITNPSTNSFKRLVPGFEAPVTVGYATSNRSAVIRIPAYAKSPELRRFEIRNPDATCNPYFCYAALLMAGIDGIKNKIDPHENGWGPYDVNLYTLPEEEKAKLKGLPTSLDAALDALEADHDYLTAGGVFPEELLKNFIKTKRAECRELSRYNETVRTVIPMNLTEAAEKLEVEIPEEMKTFAFSARELCNESLVDSLQARFDLFGSYFSLIKKALAEIPNDGAMRLWLNCAAEYYLHCDHDHARDLPVPTPDGSLARDFLPLMVMLPSVDAAYEIYRKRGFSHKDAARFLGCIKLNLFIVETRILGRPALTETYFRWLAHYLKGTIFDLGGLNFELKKYPKTACYLRNKQSGEIAILSLRERIHRSGMPLGSAGYEEEEGSFSTHFEENDTSFIGNPVKSYLVQREREVFPKDRWERFLSPGDDVVNVHIPRNTDLSPDKIRQAYKDAKAVVAKSYPEYDPKTFICSSWLMDPTLTDILGKESRISQFAAPFLRHPNKSAGKEIFSFVFRPRDAEDLSSLPENTRLERALKKMYLNGEYIYAFTGMLPFENI